MRSSRPAALALAAVLAASCATRPVDPLASPPVVTGRQPRIRALQRDLAVLFADPALQRGAAAIAVQSLDHGDALFRYNADRLLIPASTLKLVTVAAAAEVLGWDFRYTTTIAAAGPIEDGVLRGDLVVRGQGDPTINRRYDGGDGVLAEWAGRLSAGGLRRVNGRLVGDDRAFAGEPWGTGWSWDDPQYAYGAAVGALHLAGGTQPLIIVPGLEPGRPASVTLLGPPILSIDADVLTVERESAPSIAFRRIPNQRRLHVTGRIAADALPLILYPSVTNPTEQFLLSLKTALESEGIAVGGGPADIDELDAPPVTRGPPLLEHRSPPLSAIAGVTLKASHNLHAESLLRAIGLTAGPVATAEAGLRIVSGVLQAWGVPDGAVIAADGSGLSRRNYVTADALLAVLRRMATDERHRDRWMAALPLGGVDGTLANRFQSEPSHGRVRAKTGSLSSVRALAGYVRTLGDETLAFVILLNDASAGKGELDDVIDRAVDRLVTFER